MPLATRVGDAHVCPVHTGGPIKSPGSSTVNIGGQPAARAGDRADCVGPEDTIVQGSPTVFIEGRPAARVGDKCAHTGMIVSGCPTVNIGNEGGGGGSSPLPPRDRDDDERGPTGPGGGRVRPPDAPEPPGERRRTQPPAQERAVPRTPEQAVPRSPESAPASKGAKTSDAKGATGEEKKNDKKDAEKPGAISRTKLDTPTLFGSPVTMELVESLLGLARKLYPQYDEQLSRFDPRTLDAASAQLQDAIARKDVEAVNQIGSRIAGIIQNGGTPAPLESGSPRLPAVRRRDYGD